MGPSSDFRFPTPMSSVFPLLAIVDTDKPTIIVHTLFPCLQVHNGRAVGDRACVRGEAGAAD